MSFSLLAFSLSTTFTKIGAIAAFAALLGIAVLSLLVFSQAREIKRLREWAGRAPERAADMEQRVSEAASARAQQQSAVAQTVRPVPRAEPIHARPAAATGPATRVVGEPVPVGAQPVTAAGTPAAPVGAPAAPTTPATAVPPLPAPGVPKASPPAPGVPVAPATAAGATQAAQPPAQAEGSTPAAPKPIPWQQPAAKPDAVSGAQPTPASPGAVAAPNGTPPAQTPAGAAPKASAVAAGAAGAVAAPRAPSPPISGQPGAPSPPTPAEPRRPTPPSEDVVAKRVQARAGVGGRVQPSPATQPPSRSPRERADNGSGGSSRRTIGLIAVGLVVVVVLAVVLLGKGGSSPTKSKGSTSAQTTTGSRAASKHHKASKAQAKAANPADTTVSVLNGTETTGLARRVSTSLQQKGYSQAAAQFGSPPGSHEVTVVEYAGGHQADAEGVARSLSVSHVQPMEQAVATLAGSAKVVVIVGADEATKVP